MPHDEEVLAGARAAKKLSDEIGGYFGPFTIRQDHRSADNDSVRPNLVANAPSICRHSFAIILVGPVDAAFKVHLGFPAKRKETRNVEEFAGRAVGFC